jgi:hypothetical protein
MLAALVAGERILAVLAQLARRTMRRKLTVLEEAFTGYASITRPLTKMVSMTSANPVGDGCPPPAGCVATVIRFAPSPRGSGSPG